MKLWLFSGKGVTVEKSTINEVFNKLFLSDIIHFQGMFFKVFENYRRCFALSNSRILVADSDSKEFTVKDITISGNNYGYKKFENFCRVATIWEEETQSDLIFVWESGWEDSREKDIQEEKENKARKIQVFDATLTPLYHREINLPSNWAFGKNTGEVSDIQLVAANDSLLMIKPIINGEAESKEKNTGEESKEKTQEEREHENNGGGEKKEMNSHEEKCDGWSKEKSGIFKYHVGWPQPGLRKIKSKVLLFLASVSRQNIGKIR